MTWPAYLDGINGVLFGGVIGWFVGMVLTLLAVERRRLGR